MSGAVDELVSRLDLREKSTLSPKRLTGLFSPMQLSDEPAEDCPIRVTQKPPRSPSRCGRDACAYATSPLTAKITLLLIVQR